MFVYLKNDKIGTILAHILLLISFVYRLSIFAQDDIIPLNTITPIKMRLGLFESVYLLN